jgi:RNA polymerase sigma factor (sigma-70 family)
MGASAPGLGRSIRLSRLSDELLARRAERGSDRAFAVIYERYHQPLYRYCRSIVRSDADAEDTLQSTFAGALSALQAGRRTAPLRPWLFRIAHNEAISLLRNRRKDRERDLSHGYAQVESSAEDQAADRARLALLMSDLGQLPDRLRSALVLRELSGLPHDEIAIALDTTAGGAKQAIFEARQALAEFAEGRAIPCKDIRRWISAGDGRSLRARRIRAHLHDCSGCAAFEQAIRGRRAELRAIVPVLAPASAAAVLARSVSALSGSGGGVAGSVGAGAGVAGKAAATALAWKGLAGAALVVTTAIGVTRLAPVLHQRDTATRHGSHAGQAVRATAASRGVRRGGRASLRLGPSNHARAPSRVDFLQRGGVTSSHRARGGKAVSPRPPTAASVRAPGASAIHGRGSSPARVAPPRAGHAGRGAGLRHGSPPRTQARSQSGSGKHTSAGKKTAGVAGIDARRGAPRR